MNRSVRPPEPFDATRHYQSEAVAADYERARFGDWRGGLVHALECRLVRRALRAAGEIRTVLDLPAGTGRLTAALRRSGYRVVGADISAAMLERARARSGDAPLVRANGHALPLRSGSVDAVVCLRLMSHLPGDARRSLLSEMARVARVAAIAVYQPDVRSLWYLVRNKLQGQALPRYLASPAELADEFAHSGLVNTQSFALLRGVFMERAYVLTPTPSRGPQSVV